MAKRIVIIQGHPDPSREHFGYALAEEYVAGAQAAGHEVRMIEAAANGKLAAQESGNPGLYSLNSLSQ